MPVKCVYSLARISGELLYHVLPHKRKALEEELYGIFGANLDKRQAKIAVRRTFVNLCQTEAEMMLYSEMNERNIGSFVEPIGVENIDNALSAGKGVMLLFAHFGANQMIMPAVGYRGYTMCQMSAPATVWEEKLPNIKFSRMGKRALEFRWQQELSLPVTHINIFCSIKNAFLCLKKNEVLGIAIDGGGGKNTVVVDFLGRKAQFAIGAFEIALSTDCTVLPTFMVRTKDGISQMRILPPIHPPAIVPRELAVRAVTQAFADLMTQFVGEYPDHYLNFLVLRRRMSGFGDTPLFIEE